MFVLVISNVEVFRKLIALKVTNSFEVMLHVCSQDSSNHVFSYRFILFLVEANGPV